MNLPVEVFSYDLSHLEFRLLAAMYHLGDRWSGVEATMDELSILTRSNSESLRKALRGLEKANLVETTRTKRNYGKLSKNKYKLVIPAHKIVGWQEPPSHETVVSTVDEVVNIDIDSIKLTNHVSNIKPVLQSKEEKVANKWRPEGENTDGDDNIGGIGLFDDPVDDKPKLSVNKQDPKTRGRRPQEDWTTADVASEFSFLLGKKFPLLPGLVSVRKLSGALAKNRKQFKITALVEMEVMSMFFDDQRNYWDAQKNPHYLHGRYLRMFTTHLDEALDRLGLPPRNATVITETTNREEVVYASDGKRFDNSLPGRTAMKKHEQELRDKNVIQN
jgi:hypothetical protein